MKVKSLKIQNIGPIADETLPLDKPLIVFYGDIRQGKSTILNAVRLVFGGAFPSDIIRHGQTEAHVELELDCGKIRREFYRAATGEVKSRPIAFTRDGQRVARPVQEIEKFLNPFLLDQDHLVRMTELERKKYFAELFSVSTDDLDREAQQCETDARELRAKIKGYGDIELTPVEPVDVEKLRATRSSILSAWNEQATAIAERNREVLDHNRTVEENRESLTSWEKEINRLERELAAARDREEAIKDWLNNNPPLDTVKVPDSPDTSDLENQISEAAANNVRVEQYQINLKREASRKADEKRLLELERKQRSIRDERISRLKNLSASCQVPDLEFHEDGSFSYEGTQAGMLSTSQLMTLSAQLSALYPEGFGLDLIDRGESLGRSIFEFVDRAKREEKTILATVVGERPANVPENVGVFVVENGKVRA